MTSGKCSLWNAKCDKNAVGGSIDSRVTLLSVVVVSVSTCEFDIGPCPFFCCCCFLSVFAFARSENNSEDLLANRSEKVKMRNDYQIRASTRIPSPTALAVALHCLVEGVLDSSTVSIY